MSDPDSNAPADPANRTQLEPRPRKPGTFEPGDSRINRKGRPAGFGAALRAAVGDDASELVEWGLKVFRGEITIEQIAMVKGQNGVEPVPVEVGPTFKERIEAWKFLVNHHSGQAPAKVEFKVEDAAQYDLSLLTEDELDTLDRLLEKATPRRVRQIEARRVAAAQAASQVAAEAVVSVVAGTEGDEGEGEP